MIALKANKMLFFGLLWYVFYLLVASWINYSQMDYRIVAIFNNNLLIIYPILIMINIILTLPLLGLLGLYTVFTYKLCSMHHNVDILRVIIRVYGVMVLDFFMHAVCAVMHIEIATRFLLLGIILCALYMIMFRDGSLRGYKKLIGYLPILLYCVADAMVMSLS